MIPDRPRRAACLAAAAAGGALLVLAFPPFDLWPLAIPGVGALCGVAARCEIRRSTAVLSGLAFGAAFFGGAVYWVVPVMVGYGGLPAAAGVGVFALLVAYLAAFPACFALVLHVVAARHGPLAALALAPAPWIGLELVRNHLLGGFPWARLGTALHAWPPLLQSAAWVGVYGPSAVLLGLAAAGAALALQPRRRGARTLAGAALAVATLLAVTGALRMRSLAGPGEGHGLRVACIQANVPQDRKWDPASARQILELHEELTRRAVAAGARLVVWPEASLPYSLRSGPVFPRVQALVREVGTPILLGSTDQRPAPGGGSATYNSAFLIGADGQVAGHYDKEHLVPFGEYVPLRHVLFFASRLVEAVSDLLPGQGAQPVAAPGLPPVGVRICYEILFPGLIRQSVREGAGLLANLTNDAWFGDSSAPYQHFAEAVVRAVESGRWIIRAANTGISGIISPAGEVTVRSRLGEATWIEGTVEARDGTTAYVRLGDWFAWGCVIVSVCLLALPGRVVPAGRVRHVLPTDPPETRTEP